MTRASGHRSRGLNVLRTGLVLLAGALPMLACSNGVTGPSTLAGVWKLQSMERPGAAPFVPEDPERYTVVFLDNGRVGVTADCNQCGGTYSLSDESLSVSPLACTLILCPTPHGGEFASLIDGRSSLESDARGELAIQSSKGRLILRR
jgi:heat shock protein HslJ